MMITLLIKVLNRLYSKLVIDGLVFGKWNELLAGTPTAILNNYLTQFNYSIEGVRIIQLLTVKTLDFALHFNF